MEQFFERGFPTPATVLGLPLDLLAATSLARALYGQFARFDNLLRMTFFDPVAREFYADWDHAARGVVSNVRVLSAPYRCAPKVVAVVGEPTGRSPAYVTYWQRREVRPRVNEAKALRHRALSPAMGCWGPFTAYKPSKRSIPSASITAGCRSGCIGSLNPARSTVRCDSSETDRVVGDVRTSLTPRT